MKPFYNLHKGLLLYVAAHVLLLFWLSISFLMDAYSQKRDARFLEYYLQTEEKIRSAALVVAEEQSATYWLTAFDELITPSHTLSNARARTDNALTELRSHQENILALPRYADHLKFRRDQLENLTDQLSISIEEIGSQRDLIDENFNLPIDFRNTEIELQGLNYYHNLIEKMEMFRHASTYISSYQSHTIENMFVISNAASHLKLSNQLMSSLYETYLVTGNVPRGEFINRVNVNLIKMKQGYETIKLTDSYAGINKELDLLALEFVNWYENSYFPAVNAISVAMANNIKADLSRDEWKYLFRGMSDYSGRILDLAGKVNKQKIGLVDQKTIRNMIIDVLVVLFCITFVFVAIWAIRRVNHQATHDDLTGLSNRRLFVGKSESILSSTSQEAVALIKVDISKFKVINDSVGQSCGDELLRQVAQRLIKSFKKSALTSRIGGDEFAILVRECKKEEAGSVAQKVADELSGQYLLEHHTLNLKTCVGFACSPIDAKTSECLITYADLALEESKRTGPGTVIGFNPSIAQAFNERQVMEAELGFALERNEFELHYQPQVDVEKQVVDGVEALIRWRHPTRGLVSPFHFISIAEDAGMLPAIGEWVINEAARQSSVWKREYGLDLRVSVNVSAHQFVEGDLVEIVKRALARDDIDPTNFEIEITESVAMFDIKSVVNKLNLLHKYGVRIALDDFGTGYSSLSYLQDLPLDTLKIDRSFVTKLDDSNCSQIPLLESIALMAQKLELHTVAEGVETNNQLQQVCALGIDTIQGYYYSKPVCASELPADVKAIDSACSLANAA